MPLNLDALKIEVALAGYAGKSNEVVAAEINAATITSYRSVNPADVRNALTWRTTNDWGWIAGVANGWITSANASAAGAVTVVTTPTGTGGQTRRTAYSFWDTFRGESALAMDQTRFGLVTAAMDILVTANVMTGAGRTAIINLISYTAPRFTLFVTERALDYSDIAAARAE